MHRWCAVVACLFVTACSCDEEHAQAAEPGTVEAPPASEAMAEAPAEPAGPPRIRYDFATHLARAELREGDTLVMDHGVPGGAKYTLGGWRTRTGDSTRVDDTSVLLFPGVIGKVLLPVEGDGPHSLRLRARVFGNDGRLTVYIGDETVANATLPTDGTFGVVDVALDHEQLPAGEHFLQLRVPGTGFATGAGQVGLALDWVRVAPGTEPPRGAPPPAPAQLARSVDGEPAVRIPEGLALGWALDVPPGARLRGVVRGDGRLEVVARRDGAEPLELGTVRATEEGAPVDLALDTLAGDVSRIDLRAAGGEVTVVRPTVVTFDATPARPEPRKPRNVLVYLVDTLRADKLEVYDPDTRVRTPGTTRWARQAAVFDRGQSQENWTKPSVATLLSGLYPWDHTATGGEAVVPSSVTLLSEHLRAQGFHTGAFVANGYVSDKFGFDQGFGSFRNYIREGRRTQARFVAADVLQWLDDRPEDEPFFLYVHTIDPHVPYMPPEDVLETYDPDPYDGPVDFTRDRELLEKIKAGSLTVNARDRRHLEALYDGEITYHDTHLASILDGLARRGLDEDTMVVITADHGEELFDHGSVGHGHSVWQELLHVPLMIRVPGLTDEQRRVDEAVGLVDVVPTITDALGLPPVDGVDGHSLLPLLESESPKAPRATVSGFMNGWRTVLVGRHKLIQRTEQHVLLFDLAGDPGEEHDLAADHPITVRYLRGMLGLTLAGEAGRHEHEAQSTEIDAETDAQLRALGYVGTSRPE